MSPKTWSFRSTSSRQIAIGILVVLISSLPALAFRPPPEATVTATKGPIQLTLRLYKTTVKREQSLWYQIELKNVSRKRLQVYDKIFSDPWQMHDNLFYEKGIYLDITAPPGTYTHSRWPRRRRKGGSPQLRLGGEGRVKWDWQTQDYSPKEKKELAELEKKWEKQGLSEREKVSERSLWRQKWVLDKESEQDRNPAKQLWLEPGASTTTLAWAYRDEDPNVADDPQIRKLADAEDQVGDYAQLWSYFLYTPGKYKIRVVYRYKMPSYPGITPDPWEIDLDTPQIEFEVQP